MDSLRAVAAHIGLNAEFSVSTNFFGFLDGPPADVSVATQIQRLKWRHVHLNFIRVGSDQFTDDDLAEMDQALQATRASFAQVNLGIGRVEHYVILTVHADGAENIDNDGEAGGLTDRWTVPNAALDIFWVLTYAGSTAGLSPVDGPCDKNGKYMSGAVVEIGNPGWATDQTLAHECGHYLGLSHDPDPTNLMFQSGPNGGRLTSSQGTNMVDHGFTNAGW